MRMMKQYAIVLCGIFAIVAVTGCESVKGTFGSLGSVFGGASNKIEALLAAEAAGTYVVEIRKDGDVLLSEAWECTKSPETGKLTGCHKR